MVAQSIRDALEKHRTMRAAKMTGGNDDSDSLTESDISSDDSD